MLRLWLRYGVYAVFIHRMRQWFRRQRSLAAVVYYPLAQSYQMFRDPKLPFWKRWTKPQRPSLEELRTDLRRLGADPRISHVVLTFENLAPLWPRLAVIRDEVANLQSAGKGVVVWAKHYDLAAMYAVGSADALYLQPGGQVAPLGRRRTYLFFGDTLAAMGLRFHAVTISGFKAAADVFTRSSMSDELRQMAQWLMDSEYSALLEQIASARSVSLDAVKRWFDGSPFTDEEAVEAGIIHKLVRQEELGSLIGDRGQAQLTDWSEAHRRLLLAPRRLRRRPHAAVICVNGDIVDGYSQEPPFQPPFAVPMFTRRKAGDLTVVQQIRRAERDRRVKAVLLCIASGGGSASASEAMHNALASLAAKKPVVVYMDTVAASGGYYIAAPARWIVAHPTTLTGSIGVLTGRFAYAELLEKHRIAHETLILGSPLQRSFEAMTESEEAVLRKGIERIYELFLQRVVSGRSLSTEAVKAVAGGRVWTGQQALEHGLVDQVGTLNDALAKTVELAGLPDHAAFVAVTPHSSMRVPQSQKEAWQAYLEQGWVTLNKQTTWLLSPLQTMDDEES